MENKVSIGNPIFNTQITNVKGKDVLWRERDWEKQYNEYLGEEYIEIIFELDCCLHLKQEQDFLFYKNIHNIERLFIINVKENRSRVDSRFGSAQNMEVALDQNAAFRFSTIHVLFKHWKKDICNDELLNNYWLLVKEAVNKFLNAYRFVTERYAILNVDNYKDLRSVVVWKYKKGSSPKGFSFNSFSKDGSISTLRSFRNIEEHKKIAELTTLNDVIDLENFFIMDARRNFYENKKIEAIIMLTVAIELIVDSMCRYIVDNKSKADWNRDDFLLNNGSNIFKIDTHLNKKLSDIYKFFESDVQQSHICKTGQIISDRKNIVHEGLRLIKNDLNNYFQAVEKVREDFNKFRKL